MLEKKLVIEQGLWAHFPEEDVPIKHGFSTFLAGNMSMRFGLKSIVVDNRENFFRLVGWSSEDVIFIIPEHRDRIFFIEKDPQIRCLECDGIISMVPGIGIALMVGDCLPVILYGELNEKRFVGLIHAGRKGTNLKITEKAIEGLIRRGADPTDIKVAIGPGIHACCYVFHKVKRVDLVKTNIQQALDQQIPIGNIIAAEECTCCAQSSEGEPLFFSHCRAKRRKEEEGRFIAFVSL